MTHHAPTVLLLVEDDEVDVLNFRRLARRHGLDLPLTVAGSASEALSILKAGAGSGRHILLTDINMPGLTGHELIEIIRDDDALRQTIVFVVTSSNLCRDRERAYGNNVAGYVVKDTTGENIAKLIVMLKHYCAATLPPPERQAGRMAAMSPALTQSRGASSPK